MGRDFERLVGQVVASGALGKAERALRKEQAVQSKRQERRKQREQLRRVAMAQDARLIELADERASGPFVVVSLDDLSKED